MSDHGLSMAVRMAEELRAGLNAEQVAVTIDTHLGPTILIVGRGGHRAIEAAGELVTFHDPE